MSENQEMQFADPAWQPRVTQDINQEQDLPAPSPAWKPAPDAPIPQASTDETDYAQGYRAQSSHAPEHDEPFQSQPQQPSFQGQSQQRPPLQQPWQRRGPTWLWLLIGLIVFGSIIKPWFFDSNGFGPFLLLLLIGTIIWLIASGRMRVNITGEAQPAETQTFQVGAHPTLVVNNRAGSIRLRAGQEGQVSITTTKRGYLFSQRFNSDAQVLYHQDSTINRVTARVESWKPFGKNAIDFDLVVPPQTSLELVTNAGTISVEQVAGQMTLRSDAGTITADEVMLHGKSRLRTNAGSITFSGALDPGGDYELSTDLGTVDINLPADASFSLEAKTDLGTVSTNLPLTQSKGNRASGQVGSGPYPRLYAKTDLGTVRITRG